ncbi:MAG: capsule polysaccharide export protein KpsC/LpsZ, partial [Moritella dasanensis]
LCTDGLRSYISVSLENDVIHKRLNISAGIKVLDKVFHIQNVNAYHGRLKEWLIRFHGVATKYLSHYLGWHRYMDSHEKLNENEMLSLQQQLKGT